MERVAIDVLGPLPTSEDGNQYLLIAADYFTKWVEGYALPNQEAVTLPMSWLRSLFAALVFHCLSTRTRDVILNLLCLEKCVDSLELTKQELHHCIRKAMAWLRDSIRQLKVSYPNMWKIISEIGIGIYLSF